MERAAMGFFRAEDVLSKFEEPLLSLWNVENALPKQFFYRVSLYVAFLSRHEAQGTLCDLLSYRF